MKSSFGNALRYFFWLLGRNWLTIFGATLTTFSFIIIVSLIWSQAVGIIRAPYIGMITFLFMPGFFVLGLLMIPVGAVIARRRDRKAGVESGPGKDLGLPKIDFNNPRTIRVMLMIAFLSAVNFVVLGTTSYSGVVYMDSVEFCGKACHSVMEPEFAAYENSPHSRVECTACHIGPGASWFVKSKLSGAWQLFAVTFNTYERPIAAPVENLRPSRDTCEQCHQPNKFTGDRVRVITHFSEDEANTPNYTVLLMHIGGGGSEHGIHSWHIDPRRETTYTALDPQRQEIASIRVKEPDGSITEFFKDGKEPAPEDLAKAEVRTMDCIDCHNRPTHIFELPKDAVDKALNHGKIDKSLPYIRKVAVEALTEAVGEKGDLEKITRRIESHFRENHPDVLQAKADAVNAAIAETQAIYSRNVFPGMNVTWGTYINNIGHFDTLGCYRCHDGSYKTKDASKIVSDDCMMCHTILAVEEQNPQVLTDLGILTASEPAGGQEATPGEETESGAQPG
ncbi:MAG: NapC/NirT family cytochrome c [Candidatus Hydrogenedentes bacterium]|nr:NapC/NirT family cytochrome c [Candidatus Hydrogenedentota bacterium]